MDFLEKMVKAAEMENKDLKVLLDPLVKEGCLVCLDYQDPKDTEVSLVLMEQRVASEDLVIKEKRAHLDLQDHQDLWDQLDQEEKEEEKDPLEILDSEELME